MTRVKRGLMSKKSHKRLLSKAAGYRGSKGTLIRVTQEAILHAGSYAFHGRKLRKRDMRSLWITRIGEATKAQGISYSKFMNGLKKAKIEINRKILSDLIINDADTFKKIVEKAQKA